MPTVIVSGALANKPFNGGNAWTRLSWLRGFSRLGFDAWFVEQICAEACVGDDGRRAPFERSVNRAYFRQVVDSFRLRERAALLCVAGDCVQQAEGPGETTLSDVAASADLLFNISGHLSLPALKPRPRFRIYFDDDPGYTQFWHADGSAGPRLQGHDAYYTIGLNIGSLNCAIPSDGIPWRHTLPPVVLEDWPVARDPVQPTDGWRLHFTTVAAWRGPYGPVQHGGRTYGPKAHQFRKFITLPQQCEADFEIALDIHPSDGQDRTVLARNGWRIADPRRVAGSPDDFRRYVRSSDAEFSVAQGMYVDTGSGWFSDRTTRYLASGKPALVQDTGFRQHADRRDGLVLFRTAEEAIAGAADVSRRYREHCQAARTLAEMLFDSDQVIGRLLDELGGQLRGRSGGA